MNKNISIFQIAIHFLTNSCTYIRPYTSHIGNMFSVQRNIGEGRSVLVFYGCWNKLTQIGQLRTMQLYSLKLWRPKVQSQYHCAGIKVLVPLEALWENPFLSSSTSDGCWLVATSFQSSRPASSNYSVPSSHLLCVLHLLLPPSFEVTCDCI